MCNMNSPAARHRRKASKKAAKVVVSPKPARKARTRTRKPKYLSLKLELSPKIKSKMPNPEKPKNKMTHKQQKQQDQQLINLFPLHPENLVQQDNKDMHDHDHDHVAFLFELASDTSTTLHGLTTTTITTSEEEGPLIGGGHEIDHQESFGGPSLLVRTAMKCKERDLGEERWVSYWEVVEKKEQEEVSSTSSSSILGFAAAAAAVDDALGKKLQEVQDDKNGLVGLKLDYQEILNVWSDKGPLYIEGGESPQIVPDLYDGCSNGLMEGWGRSVGNLWRVPETGSMKIKDRTLEEAAKEGWKSGHREASVLRYKEKRQSRLFAKRIRYEVRKLNAEKRPRLKGRFVKRS